MSELQKIPVTIIGGFLGAGKTTLLNHVLQSSQGNQRVAVVVNDFGKVAVDAALIEHADDDMLVLSNGCVCCSLSLDFQRGLLALIEDSEFDEILVETSGVTRIEALSEELNRPALSEQLELRRVLVVVDAVRFPTLSRAIPIVRDQVRNADVVLLNRCDLADAVTREKTTKALLDINSGSVVVETEYCRLDLNEIHRLPHRGRTVEAEVSGDEWFTARIVFGGAVVKEELHKALTSLPSSVQRVKGLVTCQGGEVLHIEVAGGTVDIAARDRQVPEANLDVLVAIATVPVVDSLRRAFQEIQGVRVVDDESHAEHTSPHR